MRRLTSITLTAVVAYAGLSSAAVAQDLRSPDARDSARQISSSQLDLRSPDARDAGSHQVATYTPGRAPRTSAPVVLSPANGFSWGDAGIGAAGMLALLAIGAGTLMIGTNRRRVFQRQAR